MKLWIFQHPVIHRNNPGPRPGQVTAPPSPSDGTTGREWSHALLTGDYGRIGFAHVRSGDRRHRHRPDVYRRRLGHAGPRRPALRQHLQARQARPDPGRREGHPYGDPAARGPRAHPDVAPAGGGHRPLVHDGLVRDPLPDPGPRDRSDDGPALDAPPHRALPALRVDHRHLRLRRVLRDPLADLGSAEEQAEPRRGRERATFAILRVDLLAGLLRRADDPRRGPVHRSAALAGVDPRQPRPRDRAPRELGPLPAHRVDRQRLQRPVDRHDRDPHRRRRTHQAHHQLRVDDHRLAQPDDGCGLAPLPRVLQHLLQAPRGRPHLAR